MAEILVEEDYEGIELNQSNFVLQEDHLEALQACITPQAHQVILMELIYMKTPYHLYIKQYRHTLKLMVY